MGRYEFRKVPWGEKWKREPQLQELIIPSDADGHCSRHVKYLMLQRFSKISLRRFLSCFFYTFEQTQWQTSWVERQKARLKFAGAAYFAKEVLAVLENGILAEIFLWIFIKFQNRYKKKITHGGTKKFRWFAPLVLKSFHFFCQNTLLS